VLADLGQPPAGALQAGQPARRDQPERRRQGLLQQRAPGHHRAAVPVGQRGRQPGRAVEVGQQQGQRPVRDQHGGGVHDVLAGGAAVDQRRDGLRHGRPQAFQQRDHRIAGVGGFRTQPGRIDLQAGAGGGDRLGVRGGGGPGPGGRAGQRSLGVEHRPHPGVVAGRGPNLPGRQHPVEQTAGRAVVRR
jgi:hypothetical protein